MTHEHFQITGQRTGRMTAARPGAAKRHLP